MKIQILKTVVTTVDVDIPDFIRKAIDSIGLKECKYFIDDYFTGEQFHHTNGWKA